VLSINLQADQMMRVGNSGKTKYGGILTITVVVTAALGNGNGALAAGGGTSTSAASNASEVFTRVPLPPLKLVSGDVIAPLPAGSPVPSGDPHDLEGIWASVGVAVVDNRQPISYLPEVKAGMERQRQLEAAGTPVVSQGTLCRPPGSVAVAGNQFPTQIIQRPDKIVFIAEENRGIWQIYMNAKHPKNLRPSYTGHSVGHWEGNTLVVDSVGFNGKPSNAWGFMGVPISRDFHVVARITRANTGDKLNGDVLVVEQTYEDPKVYQKPWSQSNRARWRPDLQVLEFNCEESTPALISSGLTVQ
jgi:hypothetical protein